MDLIVFRLILIEVNLIFCKICCVIFLFCIWKEIIVLYLFVCFEISLWSG